MFDDKPRCAACGEDFPVAKDPQGGPSMGQLYPLKRFSRLKQVRNNFADALREPGTMLCGNCYYDFTD